MTASMRDLSSSKRLHTKEVSFSAAYVQERAITQATASASVIAWALLIL